MTAVIAAELLRPKIDFATLSETRFSERGSIRENDCVLLDWSSTGDRCWLCYQELHHTLLCRYSCWYFGEADEIKYQVLWLKLHIVAAYAPTLISSAKGKDRFYDSLSTTLSGIPVSDSLFLLGDFNAWVDKNFNSWQDILGPYGVGSMNENGQHLLELSSQFSLRISSSYFQGPTRIKVIWQNPWGMSLTISSHIA